VRRNARGDASHPTALINAGFTNYAPSSAIENNETDSMSISPVSGSNLQYQNPQAPKATTDDERTESTSAEVKEAQTRRDLPVQVPTKIVAVNIKV